MVSIDVSRFSASEARNLALYAERIEKEKTEIIEKIIDASLQGKQLIEIATPTYKEIIFFQLQKLGYSIEFGNAQHTRDYTMDKNNCIISWKDKQAMRSPKVATESNFGNFATSPIVEKQFKQALEQYHTTGQLSSSVPQDPIYGNSGN